MISEVVIVHRHLTHYRVPLFELLRALLRADGVNLRLLHGGPTQEEKSKRDQGKVEWAEYLPTHYFFGGRVCWQAFGSGTTKSDLVIITQENRLIYNLWALIARRLRRRPRRIAFWGHGANLQASRPDGWRERYKRALIGKVDWWFAYTRRSVELVRSAGFPIERITDLENAIDTRNLAELCSSVANKDLEEARARLGLQGKRVALYLGSLYEEKRLPFLLEACERVVQQVPSFCLLVSGEGPQREMIEQAARDKPWLRFLGMQKGRDKAIALRLAEMMLNPGLVGLGILDSFTAGIPLVTTDCKVHSPEIAYLQSGENGLMTENSLDAFCGAILFLLRNEPERRRLGINAQSVAARYTIENMAQRFRAGILKALQTKA
jgi:glycosyltransferase involved in cell wall biosynthesis